MERNFVRPFPCCLVAAVVKRKQLKKVYVGGWTGHKRLQPGTINCRRSAHNPSHSQFEAFATLLRYRSGMLPSRSWLVGDLVPYMAVAAVDGQVW